MLHACVNAHALTVLYKLSSLSVFLTLFVNFMLTVWTTVFSASIVCFVVTQMNSEAGMVANRNMYFNIFVWFISAKMSKSVSKTKKNV